MRFLQKNNIEKTILVISDLHLGAGVFVDSRRNPLEDFHHDKELVEFLEFYSTGQYAHQEVELVINGDFIDFLAVPFVPFFDDEYWSEKAAMAKLQLVLDAHQEVFEGINKFLLSKKRTITYIIGNHDAEFVFPSVRELFINTLSDPAKEQFRFLTDHGDYIPTEGVMIKHGHEYEMAHHFDLQNSLVESEDKTRYFLPPWGSYYVTRVINKFKEERAYINQIRPIKNFILHGLIFDTLFTLRFLFTNCYYFIMVRFLTFYNQSRKFSDIIARMFKELELFHDLEQETREFFYKRPDIFALIVGHTHEADFKNYADGTTFINTGTWTKMFNLDFAKKQDGYKLTYAQIDVKKHEKKADETLSLKEKAKNCEINLNIWSGLNTLPYEEF